jgi:LysM repeat protein
MFIKTPLFLALLVAPACLHAASADSQKQEYEQVRKIALRDPKVRAAYAEADRKLEAKILQIDPSLTSYVRNRTSGNAAPAAAPTKPKAVPTTQTKPKSLPADPKVYRRSYVVMKGDTLASIATKYRVTVASLKTVNHITDEKKLAVGHVLAIPNGR